MLCSLLPTSGLLITQPGWSEACKSPASASWVLGLVCITLGFCCCYFVPSMRLVKYMPSLQQPTELTVGFYCLKTPHALLSQPLQPQNPCQRCFFFTVCYHTHAHTPNNKYSIKHTTHTTHRTHTTHPTHNTIHNTQCPQHTHPTYHTQYRTHTTQQHIHITHHKEYISHTLITYITHHTEHTLLYTTQTIHNIYNIHHLQHAHITHHIQHTEHIL